MSNVDAFDAMFIEINLYITKVIAGAIKPNSKAAQKRIACAVAKYVELTINVATDRVIRTRKQEIDQHLINIEAWRNVCKTLADEVRRLNPESPLAEIADNLPTRH